MPLPGTRTIPAGWSGHHRPSAAAAMNAVITVEIPSTERAVWDEATGQNKPAEPTILYDGPARVQELRSAHWGIQSEDSVRSRTYLVQLDALRAAQLRLGPTQVDVAAVRFTHCAPVPGLVDLTRKPRPGFAVVDDQSGSEGFTRDLIVQQHLG